LSLGAAIHRHANTSQTHPLVVTPTSIMNRPSSPMSPTSS
jgi:hypothetical protein